MKHYTLLFCVALVSNFYSNAQSTNNSVNRNIQTENMIPIESKYIHSQKFPNSIAADLMREGSGKSLTIKEFRRLPIQSINRIAATSRNVESRDGETPTIKAAPQSGTAYYLDGVRLTSPLLPK